MAPKDFRAKVDEILSDVFTQAKVKDELGFVFSILGIDSGVEAPGWRPFAETEEFVNQLLWMVKSPLPEDARMRMALVLYCHISEASYIYHVIYNLLQTIDGKQPKVFNFLSLYTGSKPPSVSKKIQAIKDLAKKVNLHNLADTFSELFFQDIRNAFLHSDYIIYNNEVRLKHKGSKIYPIPFKDMWPIIQNTIQFYGSFMTKQHEALKSFLPGHIIKNRKNDKGYNLSDVKLVINAETRYLEGFEVSDPLPMW